MAWSGREEAVRSDVARLPEATSAKVVVVERSCITVADRAAGDLTQHEVVGVQVDEHERRAPLGLREIRERERDDDHVPLHKPRQASSSSGRSQSLASAGSLITASSSCSAAAFARRKRTKSSTSATSGSGTSSIA